MIDQSGVSVLTPPKPPHARAACPPAVHAGARHPLSRVQVGLVAGQRLQEVGQGAGVAGGECEAVLARAHAFRKAADPRGQHRAAEHPGLGDDEPKNLPPGRGGDHPVDRSHALGEVVALVGVAVDHLDLRLEAREVGEEASHLRGEGRAGEMLVRGVDLDDEPLRPARGPRGRGRSAPRG